MREETWEGTTGVALPFTQTSIPPPTRPPTHPPSPPPPPAPPPPLPPRCTITVTTAILPTPFFTHRHTLSHVATSPRHPYTCQETCTWAPLA